MNNQNNALLDKFFANESITLKEAFIRINKTGKRILLILDDEKILKGVLTDSNLRNAVISGMTLDKNISGIINRDFKYILITDPKHKEKSRKIMLENNIEQIPVLDIKGRVVSVIFWTDLFKDKKPEPLTNEAVIMAGGKGTRLDPFTKILPKALIPIGEEPIIDLIIKKFTTYGINNITISVNHKKEIIKNYFLENKHDIKINWIEEDSFNGTAGSLRLLKGHVDQPFFVTNCDIILDANYKDILSWHVKENKGLTLVASYKQVNIPYGVVGFDNGNLKDIEEKPSFDVLVNCGFYVINPEIIDELPEGVFDMDQLLKELLKKEIPVGVFPVYSGWFDTGQWEEYRKTIRYFEGMV